MILYIYLILNGTDENDSLLSSGTEVLLKFDTLYSLENYTRWVYYHTFPLNLYFKCNLQSFTVLSMPRMPLNMNWKRGDCQQSKRKICYPKKENVRIQKKREAVRKRYNDKSASIRQYIIEEYMKNLAYKIAYFKAKCQENPELQLTY